MGLMDFRTRLSKLQLTTLALIGISEFFLFLATITPAWQVAEDTDVGRSIQSGLWIYCPGSSQCWYIFSDDLINYYERVDVCRFLLIGDCRKKLLRTPYFFGWHYAVLILMLIVMILAVGVMVLVGMGMVRARWLRITTILSDVLLSFAFLFCGIALAVFLINAEMLESKYLIGVKNTFRKTYGYSFYLSCLGATVLLFALMAAIVLTSSVFFMRDADAGSPGIDDYGEYDEGAAVDGQQQIPPPGSRMGAEYFRNLAIAGDGGDTGPTQTLEQYNKMVAQKQQPSPGYGTYSQQSQQQYSWQKQQQQGDGGGISPMTMKFVDDFDVGHHIPRYCYASSEVTSIP